MMTLVMLLISTNPAHGPIWFAIAVDIFCIAFVIYLMREKKNI